jgi:CheY-like chemotaxis protein/DNA-directed RNA polymerase specialized sigma24 family protein
MTSFAAAIHAELPRLRRYAHGTSGSAELGDRCIAECLERIARDPGCLDAGLGMPTALYRLFHETSGNIEAAPAPAVRPAVEWSDRLWRALAYLPLGERQALMLVSVEGLDVADVGRVLGVQPSIVRDRVARAERALLRRTAASVLIIEDEYLLAADLSRIVTEMGHEVCGAAADCAEAIELAERCKPMLVLADVQLRDGESGEDAVEQIRKRVATEVIFVTAHASRLARAKADAAAVVEKPFRPEVLKQAMGRALARAAHA